MAALISLLLLLSLSLSSGTATPTTTDAADLSRLLSDLGLPPLPTHPCHLPGISCQASAPIRIALSSRHLDGTLSPAIAALTSLRELSLPRNQLSGPLPPELGSCSALEILDLRYNRLSGAVPPELSSLSSLRVLDLSANRLAGDLHFLTQLPNLETLSLSDNLFFGKVPPALYSLRNLLTADLSLNPGLDLGEVSTVPHNRRSLLLPATRFIIHAAENSTRNSSSPSISSAAAAPAPGPAAAPHRHHSTRTRVRNWIVGFIVGSVSGIVSGFLITLLFRMILNCIHRRYTDPSGPSIYSPLIKRSEDLAFLERDDGLASLEVIGRGGCGEVYKAQLPPPDPRDHPEVPGKLIAIKKIRKLSAGDLSEEDSKVLDKHRRQIRSEIRTVGQIRHRNLLSLVAHVSRPDSDYLVYEYMKNGSLHDALRAVAEGRRELDWPTRHRIALGIAAGLEYLHIHHSPRIIHRDLKPANILLDNNMEARIADFGFAKQVPDNNTHMTTSNVAGTVGYIAPEYHQLLKFTVKCDIYSFGVILVALVMGRQPSDDFFQETEEMSLVKWMHNTMRSEDPRIAIDRGLLGNAAYEEQMLLVLRIACFCTVDDPKERPNSKDVRTMLAQIVQPQDSTGLNTSHQQLYNML